MEPITISMRGLAEVSCAKASQKQSKLKRFKFRDSEESRGRSNYYVWALSAIKRHHRGEAGFVDEMLHSLHEEAASESDSRKKAKLLANHRAITDYLKHFGHRPLEIRPGARLHFNYQNLIVNAHPDLVAEEEGRLLLIKLNCCKEDFAGGVTSTLLHVMYESAKMKGLEINSTSVECFADVEWLANHRAENGISQQVGITLRMQGVIGDLARRMSCTFRLTLRR